MTQLSANKSKQILEDIFASINIDYDSFQKTERGFEILLVDKLKHLTILISWVFNLEIPEKLNKKPMIEFLLQNIHNCEREPSAWIMPSTNKNAQTFKTYIDLASKFQITWMREVNGELPFYTPREQIPVSPQLELPFFYQNFRAVGLFEEDLAKNYELLLRLSNDSLSYLLTYSKCHLLLYFVYEELDADRIPRLRVIEPQAVLKPEGHPQLIFANGVALKIDILPENHLKDKLLPALPFDITPAAKLKCPNIFLDLQCVELPPHSDSETAQYAKPYILFYLAKTLETDEVYQMLLKKKFLTSSLFNKALKLKNAFPGKEILEVGVSLDDEEITQTSETLALTSHLSMKRLVHPVRSSQCRHFNKVMDLEEFIEKVKCGYPLRCSVCNEPCKFDQLFIDAFGEYCIQNGGVGSVEVRENGEFELVKESAAAGNEDKDEWDI